MQNPAINPRDAARRSRGSVLNSPPLSLHQAVPTDWHDDLPAFAGDPFMDWENRPEPPRESDWGIARQKGQ